MLLLNFSLRQSLASRLLFGEALISLRGACSFLHYTHYVGGHKTSKAKVPYETGNPNKNGEEGDEAICFLSRLQEKQPSPP